MSVRPITSTIAVAALCCGAIACDSETASGPSPDGLSLSLYTVPGSDDPFAGVAFVQLRVEGEGVPPMLNTVTPYTPGASIRLDRIPFSEGGASRQLVIEGWTGGATGQPELLVSRGRSNPVVVKKGEVAQAFKVMFSKVNSFLDLVSVDGGAPQRLLQGRVGHTATPTAVGEIVIAGGGSFSSGASEWWTGTGFDAIDNSVEALDETTHVVSPRSPLLQGRAWHTANALSSGQIIIAGGFGAAGGALDSVELYNPPGVLEGTSKPLPPLATARAGHTATLLDEGERLILFVGGDATGTWELWDPVNGSGGARPLLDSQKRRFHTATTFFLPGRVEPAVLIAGGDTDVLVHQTAMLFDSVQQTMIPVANFNPMPGGKRTHHASVYVADRGFIYVTGGYTQVTRLAATGAIDVFDVNSQTFKDGLGGFRMRSPRGGHAATLNPNNTIVLSGGGGAEPADGGHRPLSSVEVIHEFLSADTGLLEIQVASSYNPGATATVPFMPSDRLGHRSVGLQNGTTVFIGGAGVANGGTYQMVPALTLYNPL